ncbi:tetratricopeptide repeat protein [Andreprevotia lacus]|nr:tetratricopeptide repeat protein [Andreprevotia lacus]
MSDLNAILSAAFQAHQNNDIATAIRGYQTVLQQLPGNWQVRTLLATAQLQSGDLAGAEAGFMASLQLNQGQADAWLNLGNVRRERGALQDALAAFDQCLALNADFPPAWVNRGNVLTALGRHADAISSHQRALALAPDYADAHGNLAIAYWEQRDFAAALAAAEQAIALDNADPAPWLTRGHALRGLSRYADSLQSYEAALARNPSHAHAWQNKANALCDLGRHAEALQSYAQALQLTPDDADIQWAIALTQLQLGQFAEGWANYEARWRLPSRAGDLARFAIPRWAGEPLQGKRIVLHTEQGFGDAIQFSRFALTLLAQGAHVTLEVKAPLQTLLQSLSPAIQIVAQAGSSFADHDYHCPLMSLPHVLGTTLATLPAQTPYLHASRARQAEWAARLGAPSALRVGLVWSGSPTHKDDYSRSIPLAQLAGLVATPGTEFHSLHERVRDSDQAALAQLPITSHADRLSDFEATAALISQLDLVITVDTAVAHLAGALGKPVWVLLPVSPDFRWLLDRSDNPWYPDARLFRQRQAGDWPGVLAEAGAALALLASQHAGTPA